MKRLLEQLANENPVRLTDNELRAYVSKAEFSALERIDILENITFKEILCPECESHTIEVHALQNTFFGYCHSDDVGKIIIPESQVNGWQLQTQAFLKAFLVALDSENEPKENIRRALWSMGTASVNGNTYTLFFTPSLQCASRQNVESLLSSVLRPVLFYIDDAQPASLSENVLRVSVQNVISTVDKNGIVLDAEQFSFYFPTEETYDAEGDIILDANITLSPKNKMLYFGTKTNGKVSEFIKLSPRAVNIIAYMHQIKDYESNTRTNQELANSFASGSLTSLRNRLAEIKNACIAQKTKQIIDKSPEGEYRLNPRLDCMK